MIIKTLTFLYKVALLNIETKSPREGSMFIKAGATRLVVFTPQYAIKIARVPIIGAIVAFLVSLRRKLQSKSPFRFSRVGIHATVLRQQMFGRGLRANRAEAMYWNATKDVTCIPVVKVLFGGWIIIQPRAQTVTKSDVLRSNLCNLMLTDVEFKNPKQFGRFGGRIVILDYASLGDPTLGAVAPDQLT